MKRSWLGGIVALALVVTGVGAAWATFGDWGWRLERMIWPPLLDEDGYPAHEVVSETPLHPWPQAVTVRLFVEADDPSKEQRERMIEPQGRVLTVAQRAAFEGTLAKRSIRNPDVAACFIPHHFFRYYDAAGKQVGEIAICFCCSGASASPALFPGEGGFFLHPYQNYLVYDRERLGALIRSWGLPTDVWCR